MASHPEHTEAQREDLVDFARYLAAQPVPFEEPGLSPAELAIARALISLNGIGYAGGRETNPDGDRRQQMFRVLAFPE
jgi:hypothetical protein